MPTRLIVADDEPDMLELVSLLLARRGFQVTRASTSAAALAQALADPPDAILLDLMMPDMDGLEVCRRLRADPRTADLPILAVTARAGWDKRAAGLRAGIDDYVTKPFDADDLAARIEAALAGKPPANARLVTEIVQATLVTLDCQLVWLLGADSERQTLGTVAIASAPSETLGRELLRRLRGESAEVRLSLTNDPLASLMARGDLRLNWPVNELADGPDGQAVASALIAIGVQAIAAIPIMARGKPVGLLIYDSPPGAPRSENARLAALASNVAAAALANHRLVDDLRSSLTSQQRTQAQLEERNRRLDVLIQASREMTSSLSLADVPARILEEATGVMDAEGGAILLMDELAGGLTFAAATGPGAETVRGTTIPPGAGVAGWVAQTGQPTLVDETQQDSRFYREVDRQTGMSTRSLLAVPLLAPRGVIGVLEMLNKRGRPFDASDRSLLESLAMSAVVAIQNAQLFARLESSLKALADSQAQLIRAEKLAATGRMAAMLAHEINNPLQSVRTALTLAARAELPAEERRKFLALAESETQRLAGLVQRMLEFHRTPKADRGPIDLRAVVEKVVTLAEPRLRQYRIEVVRDWPDDLPPVPGSADQLTQVFLNLVLNACDSLAGPGRIALRLRPAATGEAVIAEVADTGPGIPPAVRERLFEPFYTTKETGTGLGLAVTHDIVERHGGQIEVESEAGKGATFRISLPARIPSTNSL